MNKSLVVTGCDVAHFDLAADLISSFRTNYGDRFTFAFIKFGPDDVPDKIARQVDKIVEVNDGYAGFRKEFGYYAAYALVKPSLPDLIPGFDNYCWMDSDTWFANGQSLNRIFGGAQHSDICIHPEYDIHYFRFPTPHPRCVMIYQRNEAANLDSMPLTRPMFNTGVFAARASSKVWRVWRSELESLKRRYHSGENVYFSDQIPLHKLIHTTDINVIPLRAVDNWLINITSPIFDQNTKRLRLPTPPFEEIGVVHFAGPKESLVRTDASGRCFSITYSGMMEYFGLAEGDGATSR
jgi:hypothetical protein